METLELAGIPVKPGEVEKGYLGFVTLADFNKVGVPVVIANGVETGPTLLLVGSVHGSEVVGVGAIQEVIRQIDPKTLRGRLIAVTIANPFAFQVGSYVTSYDSLNLSSPIFLPPRPNGQLTERIAALIAPAVQASTHLIDVHANPDPSMPFVLLNLNLCQDEATYQETVKIAEAWGTTVINNPRDAPSSLRDTGVVNGIASITPELTGNRYLREDSVRVGVIGITNVMKAIGMIDGEIQPQPEPKLDGPFVAHGRVATQSGGLLWVRVKPGKFLRQGEVIAEMRDAWGDTVEEITMPTDGYCWSFTGNPLGGGHAVPEGTLIAYVFRKAD